MSNITSHVTASPTEGSDVCAATTVANLTTIDDTRYANELAPNIQITVEMETNIDTTISHYGIVNYAIHSNIIVKKVNIITHTM